jgi:hypothetical protein
LSADSETRDGVLKMRLCDKLFAKKNGVLEYFVIIIYFEKHNLGDFFF